MSRTLLQLWTVAENELLETVRSKRVLVVALLYLGGAVGGTLLFIEFLTGIEESLSEGLGVAAPSTPGALSQSLFRSPQFLTLLTRWVEDRAFAEQLVAMPPLSLFYGWMSLTFLPLMVTLTAAETISSELGSGAVRFQLLRVDRLTYSLGKLLGQTLLMVGSVVSGAALVWLAGRLSMAQFDAWSHATWLLRLSLRAGCYGFAYVGLVVGLSHLTRSVPASRAIALFALVAFSSLSSVLDALILWGDYGWAESVAVLLPSAHKLDLLRPTLPDRLPAILILGALGSAYFAAGFVFRQRRDW